ncbi:hypothetical protein Tco_0755409 [Tanacetum coccineum]
MQLIQKLRDDQKCMKKDFKDVSGSYVQKSNKDLESSSIVYYKVQESEVFQEMQLIQKLRDDQKHMKKAFEDVSRSYVQKSNQDRESSSAVYYNMFVYKLKK